MAKSNPDTLVLARQVLRVLIRVNQVLGIGIGLLLAATLAAQGPVMGALGIPPTERSARMMAAMRLIMVLGLVAVPVAHGVFTRLLAIVGTVDGGDPFVAENAERLRRIAWAVLGLEVLHLCVAGVAAWASTQRTPLDVGGGFSVTPWLAALLLFVLAGVFRQGARMRDDLEGTV